MRIAVLSDIHSNHLALRAVLDDSHKREIDQYWCLGDFVGYGPNPLETIKWLMGEFEDFMGPEHWVMGNHDVMLAELIMQGRTGVDPSFLDDPINPLLPSDLDFPSDLDQLSEESEPYEFIIRDRKRTGELNGKVLYRGMSRGIFNKYLDWRDLGSITPVVAIELNRRELAHQEPVDNIWRDVFTPEKIQPMEVFHDGFDFVLVHGAQVGPASRYIYAWNDEILLPEEFSRLGLQAEQNNRPRIQLFGHTHVPTFVRGSIQQDQEKKIDSVFVIPGEEYPIIDQSDDMKLAMINPGSVGQPRDLDQRASYAIIDTEENLIVFHRVKYEYQRISQLLIKNHYPNSLAIKLLEAKNSRGTPAAWEAHYRHVKELSG
jgi:predicted phosphodiesterase